MGEQRITRAERLLGQQSPRALIRDLASLVLDGELGSNVIVEEVLLAICLGTSGRERVVNPHKRSHVEFVAIS